GGDRPRSGEGRGDRAPQRLCHQERLQDRPFRRADRAAGGIRSLPPRGRRSLRGAAELPRRSYQPCPRRARQQHQLAQLLHDPRPPPHLGYHRRHDRQLQRIPRPVMTRILIEYIIPLLLPSGVFVVYTALTKSSGGEALEERLRHGPWFWLIV